MARLDTHHSSAEVEKYRPSETCVTRLDTHNSSLEVERYRPDETCVTRLDTLTPRGLLLLFLKYYLYIFSYILHNLYTTSTNVYLFVLVYLLIYVCISLCSVFIYIGVRSDIYVHYNI